VHGSARFTADISFPGTLACRVVRSPHAHARILSVDTKAAEEVPGVRAVVTGEGCREIFINLGIGDQHPMAVDKVRHEGEPVAAVLAGDKWTAAEAADLIEIEYEALPAVLDPEDALADEAPLVHERQEDYARGEGVNYEPGSNVYHHYRLRKGNPEEIFAGAEYVEENTFDMPHRSHTQIEPHAALARWRDDGVDIYASTQAPFIVRTVVADMFGLPMTAVQVHTQYLGGGFGGKSDVTIEPLLAYIARSVPGRWVKLTLDREEAFNATVVGRGARVKIRSAFNGEGRILAEQLELYFASGAYGSYALHITNAGGHNCNGPYDVEHVSSDSYGVYTNQPPVGAFRGYSHPETHWAVERQRDIIAGRLGMEPTELRRRNLLRPGSVNNLGQTIKEENGDLAGCLEAAERAVKGFSVDEYAAAHPERRIGRGIVAIMKSPVMATNAGASAIIRFNEDGTADLAVSGVEMGQGTKTVMRQIAAEALSRPLESICIRSAIDTDTAPYGWQTIGSTTTWKGGMAVLDAAEKAVRRIKENAAASWGCAPEELEYDGQYVVHRDDHSRSLPVDALVFGHMDERGRVTGEHVQAYGSYMPQGLEHPDPVTGRGNCAGEWTFGAQGAVVAVDPADGEMDVLYLMTALDAGRVINPTLARDQVVGAMVQELGAVLREELIYGEGGAMRNKTFTDYKIPAPEDVADTAFDVEFLETPEPIGPFGARGIAEHGTVGIAAAMGNAVRDALGIEAKRLPLTAERLHALLAAQKLSEKEPAEKEGRHVQ
jgi:carbon-monoxide dehydrogenase large subunit